MSKSSSDDTFNIPQWLIKPCKWFWGKREFVWSTIVLNIVLGAGVGWAFLDPTSFAKLPIGIVSQHPFVILTIFIGILALTIIAGLTSRLSVAPSARELKKQYLKRMAVETETLTLRGIPAGLISESVRLDEVFIPLQLRPNRPRTDYPLTDKELEYYRECVKSGTFARELDRIVLDAERNWQHLLNDSDRISIADLWQHLTSDHPAAVI